MHLVPSSTGKMIEILPFGLINFSVLSISSSWVSVSVCRAVFRFSSGAFSEFIKKGGFETIRSNLVPVFWASSCNVI